MPIYEYSCPKCGVFERLQKFSEPNLEHCPTCGEKVRKLIGRNVGIVFKAGGYYASDNRPKDYVEKAKQDNSETSSSQNSPSQTKTAAE
jgi:putative FmdB family regulatory protein